MGAATKIVDVFIWNHSIRKVKAERRKKGLKGEKANNDNLKIWATLSHFSSYDLSISIPIFCC
jgi:hypothetical protein